MRGGVDARGCVCGGVSRRTRVAAGMVWVGAWAALTGWLREGPPARAEGNADARAEGDDGRDAHQPGPAR
jgi:hypothetical protein